MDIKTDLRKKAKDIRKSLPIFEISRKLVSLIRKNKIYIDAKNVMIFYPKKYEIDLRELLDDDKEFYLPRVNGKMLEVCKYSKEQRLKLSSFNVLEPITEAVSPCILDLIIVPALLVDKNKYRLGYGGGYYDRLLKITRGNVKSLVPIPKELVVESLPVDSFDVSVDDVVITI